MTLTGALGTVANRGSGHGMRLFRGDHEMERVSFDQLYAEAGQLACGLLERGVLPGERVGIATPTSADFARAFFGVLAAGAVPVPLPPPSRFASLDIHLRRIAVALRQSRVKKVLSNVTLGGLLEAGLAGAPGEPVVLVVAQTLAAGSVYAKVAADQPALVQYTSGTVGEPKGVVLSHANILANVDSITQGLGVTDTDVCCTWLPLFHDMGLIGTFLCAVLNDLETCILPPEDFLRDPARWVKVISQHRASMTTAPSSGYLHTLRRVPSQTVRELDLSCWRLALNGAETVDAEVMRRFSAHFAPAGFRPTSFLPVYGLAECSLAVTFPPIGRSVRSSWVRRDLLSQGVVGFSSECDDLARELVSVGTPVARTEVRLVGEDGVALVDEVTVGEIQVRGPSVMRGYEADQRATREVVRDDGWVATGDLGFEYEGELFVVGRKKEMIIMFGRNYYASDIESVASGIPGISVHGALAAAVPFVDGEALVLFVETSQTQPAVRSDLVARVRYAVSSALGITPREIVAVQRGKLPRTSSGKLRRRDAEVLYQQCTSEVGTPTVTAADRAGRST